MALPAGQAAAMKTIMCYGDSNTWGCIPLTGQQPPRRYGPAQRWPGVLRRELGDGHWIVEEGLNGRTTVWDDPLEPFRSGKELLAPCLMTHEPIDLVIVMLGTNDLKRRFGVGARHRGGRRTTARHCSRQHLRSRGIASAGTPRLSTPARPPRPVRGGVRRRGRAVPRPRATLCGGRGRALLPVDRCRRPRQVERRRHPPRRPEPGAARRRRRTARPPAARMIGDRQPHLRFCVVAATVIAVARRWSL